MSKLVVLLNGPLGSGKDYIAEHLVEKRGGCVQQFKQALYIHTAELFGVDLNVFKDWATCRVLKELPRKELIISKDNYLALCDYLDREVSADIEHTSTIEISPRDAMIYTSELVYKPEYGKDYFGFYTSSVIDASEEEYHYISDSGFFEEALTVVDTFGADNVKLFRIYREDAEFDSRDSRSYIDLQEYGVSCKDLDNNRHISEVIADIEKVIEG